MASENVAELVAKLIDDVTAPARAAGNSIKGLVSDVQKSNSVFESLSRQASRNFDSARTSLVATAMAAGAFYIAIKKPIEQAMSFASTLKTLQIQTGRTEEQIKSIEDRFDLLGSKLHISAQTIAEVATKLPASIRASNDSMMMALEVSGKFARAWDTDIGATVQGITPLVNVLGLSVKDLSPAFDMITRASKSANIPITTLMENMPKLSEELKSLHMSGLPAFQTGLAWVTAMTAKTGSAELALSDYTKVMERAYKAGFGRQYGFSMRHVQEQAKAQGKDIGIALFEALEKITKSRGPGMEKIIEGQLARLIRRGLDFGLADVA
jgi:TP901 family phage tail tape measure protein